MTRVVEKHTAACTALSLKHLSRAPAAQHQAVDLLNGQVYTRGVNYYKLEIL